MRRWAATLPFLILRRSKQHFLRLLIQQRLAQIRQHLHATLDGRTRGDLVMPALGIRKVIPVDSLILP